MTHFVAMKAKNMQITHGILSIPSQKIGKRLCTETIQSVIDFYLDDSISRVLPGKKIMYV